MNATTLNELRAMPRCVVYDGRALVLHIGPHVTDQFVSSMLSRAGDDDGCVTALPSEKSPRPNTEARRSEEGSAAYAGRAQEIKLGAVAVNKAADKTPAQVTHAQVFIPQPPRRLGAALS